MTYLWDIFNGENFLILEVLAPSMDLEGVVCYECVVVAPNDFLTSSVERLF